MCVALDPSILYVKLRPISVVEYDFVKMKRPVVMRCDAASVVEPGVATHLSSASAPA